MQIAVAVFLNLSVAQLNVAACSARAGDNANRTGWGSRSIMSKHDKCRSDYARQIKSIRIPDNPNPRLGSNIGAEYGPPNHISSGVHH